MGQIKIDRIREKIKAETARVIMELNDPRKGFLTVQNVELAADLRHAKIFISVLGSDAEKRKVMRMLDDATGFIQREVAGTLRTRVTPALHFVLDTSIDKSFKVAEILKEIEKEKGSPLERSEGLDSEEELPETAPAPVAEKKAKKKKRKKDEDDEDEGGDDWDDV